MDFPILQNNGRLKNNKMLGFFLLFILCFLLPRLAFAAPNDWWNRAWGYRKPVTITNNGASMLTDFQVKITTGAFDTGKIQSDGADLCFVDAGGNLQSYWIESGTGIASRDVWVKLSYIPTGTSTIYMYYGNPDASTVQSGDNTFELFDDFERTSVGSNWVSYGDTGPWSIDSGRLKAADTDGSAYSFLANSTRSYNNTDTFILETKIYFAGSAAWGGVIIFSDGVSAGHHIDFNPQRYSDRATSTALESPEVPTVAQDTWYDAKFVYDGSTLYWYHNGTLAYQDAATGSEGLSSGYIGVVSNYYYNYVLWDNFRVRKYASTEPTAGTPGSEESAPALSSKATLGAGSKGSGPVGYWNFDDAGGPTAHDVSGSATVNNGTLNAGGSGTNTAVGHMWYPQGKFGGCLEFDGTNDYVNVSSGISTTNAITVEAWIRSDGITDIDTIYLLGSQSGAVGFHWLYLYTTSINWQYAMGSGYVAKSKSFTATQGQWYHVVVTHDYTAKEVIFYIDGQSLGTITHTDDVVPVSNKSSKIGTYSTAHPYFGLIDEVKIYDRALSAAEVQMAYTAGAAAHLGAGTDPNEGNPPIAWWQFDENTGIDAYDRSGNNNNGTVINAAWAAGKYGNALSFDGENDRVNCGHDTSFDTEVVTYEAWVKPRELGRSQYISGKYYDIFSISYTDPKTYWYFNVQTDAGMRGCSTSSAGPYPTIDIWTHLVGTYNGVIVSLYVDGNLVKSTDYGTYSAMTTNAVDVYIGQEWYNRSRFNGLIDDVKIYDYARTPAQIAYDYNKGKPVGWWKLDEAVGVTAYDSSGKGNNGTLIEMDPATDWVDGKFGKALDLDGENDYVDITDSDSLSFGNTVSDSPFSISVWIKMNDATGFWIVSKGSTTAREYYFHVDATDKLRLLLFDNTSTNYIGRTDDSAITSSQGSWMHIVGTYSGSSSASGIKLYINGIRTDDSNSNNGTYVAMHNQSQSMTIGRFLNDGAGYANGLIDDVRIYNYARTPLQILQDYNEGAAAKLGD